jgi:hypothetical protein
VTFLEVIKTNLLANATITSIVGQKLFPIILPQGNSLPCILYRKKAGAVQYEQDGIVEHTITYQFEVIAEQYHVCESLHRAIKEVLELTSFTCDEGNMDECHYAGFEEEQYYDDLKAFTITENYQFSINN